MLLLMIGMALGGALLWQNAQEAAASPTLTPKEKPFASENSILDGGEQPALASVPGVSGEGSSSLATERPRAVSEPLSFAASVPDSPEEEQGDANFAASEGSGEIGEPETDAFAVEGQVTRAAAAVSTSYFDDAIFFGDSISTGITAYNIANNTACVAAIGVSPQTALSTGYIAGQSGEKLTLLEAAKKYGTRAKVYIMLGGNGIAQDKEAFITAYQQFIDAVRLQYPDAIVYIQSMTPVTDFVQNTYPDVTNQKVMEYNEAIAGLAMKNGLPFVNVFEALCGPDGTLPANASSDGLHFSAEYYFKWFDYLKTHTVEGM